MPRHPARDRLTRSLPFALTGVLAAVAGIAVGHLVAGLLDPASSPVLAVGSAVIDATPTPVKEYAVARFGTRDKPILLGSVTVVTVLASAVAGVLARRRSWLGVVFILLLTGLATLAALTRPVAAPVDALPGVAAAVTGVAVLLGLLAALRGRRTVTGDARRELPATAYPTAHDGRRTFLLGAGAVTLGAAGAATFGQRLASTGGPASTTLPAPAIAARPLPKGLERKVRGISPLRTGNATFYRVDTNLTVPRVDADRWSLTVDGMVDRPYTLSYAALLAMPMMERDITMTCVSNEVGGGYVGAARWLGVRLSDVLERAGIQAGADQLFSTAVDGFTISTPLDALRDGRDAMLVVGMNGEPLPATHGYPARLVVPGLYGFVSATKWVTRLSLSTYAKDKAYWTERSWATDAPVKTSARIDTPKPLSSIKPGRTAIGGVAWAQHRGVGAVEVSVDEGPWRRTTLGPDVGIDYWRQWYLPWDAEPGRHSLRVRATDRTGTPQVSTRATPFPNGSSGIQEVIVFVQ
jgi:DMSO/TMAO reductase YedYZ molybdopterin-dependent catalytic subunit